MSLLNWKLSKTENRIVRYAAPLLSACIYALSVYLGWRGSIAAEAWFLGLAGWPFLAYVWLGFKHKECSVVVMGKIVFCGFIVRDISTLVFIHPHKPSTGRALTRPALLFCANSISPSASFFPFSAAWAVEVHPFGTTRIWGTFPKHLGQ
jgi:hypothetical protein